MSNKEKNHFKKGAVLSGIIFIIMLTLLVAIFIINYTDGDKKSLNTQQEPASKPTQQVVENDKPVEQTGSNSSVKNYIPVEIAIDIALANTGTDHQSAKDIDVELEHKFGQVVYEVNFDSGQYEYEFYINAENGEIVKSFQEVDFNQ